MEIPKTYSGKQIDKYYMHKNNDGTYAKTIEDRQKRWTDRIKTCFQSKPKAQNPTTQHITEQEWGSMGQIAHETHRESDS